MTDGNRFAEYNIKDFGKLSNQKVGCYRYSLKEDEKEDFESMASCPDGICIEYGNDHSFRGNFDYAITSIDTLPALFKDSNGSNCSAISLIFALSYQR